jgi:DNA-binding NarL/FixJ family response regulator
MRLMSEAPPRIFIVDPNAIFRLGMIACLTALPRIGAVTGCDTAVEAWQQLELFEADLVLLDLAGDHVDMVIAQLHRRVGAPIMVMTQSWHGAHVLEAVDAGAVGVLCKDGLTAESLGLQVRAALHGAGVVPPQLLNALVERRSSGPGVANASSPQGGLTVREQRALGLIAEGKLTREVAAELAYSERTVKTLLRDAGVKLGARSRSQAVAYAVREGLI